MARIACNHMKRMDAGPSISWKRKCLSKTRTCPRKQILVTMWTGPGLKPEAYCRMNGIETRVHPPD